jgi:hypothetical protein
MHRRDPETEIPATEILLNRLTERLNRAAIRLNPHPAGAPHDGTGRAEVRFSAAKCRAVVQPRLRPALAFASAPCDAGEREFYLRHKHDDARPES